MRLATDIIDVARPILERSPVLTDNDLANLATTQSEAHRFAISGRLFLSALVTDVLVKRGSPRVLIRVAGNDGAELSPDGVATLVERSSGDEVLEATLASRRDRPDGGIGALLPHLSGVVADRLAALGFKGMEGRGAELQERLRKHFADRSRDLKDVVTIAGQIKAGKMRVEDSVLRLAQARRSYDLGALFGMLTEIPRQITIRTIQKREIEPLLILCRTLGLSWQAVSSILEMRAVRARETYSPSRSIRLAYEALDLQAAEKAVRLLRVRARAADPV